MADSLTVLYYDTANTKWVQLKTRVPNEDYISGNYVTPTNKPFAYDGGNPILGCEISDIMGAPLECHLTLNNRQSNPRKPFVEPNPANYTFGEDPLVNSQLGQFHNLINEHTDIIVHETNTFMTLFVGKVLEIDETYDLSAGSLILLTCRDLLDVVASNNLSPLSEDDGLLRQTHLSTVPDDDISNGGRTNFARNSLDIIRNIVKHSGGDNIEIPGIDDTFGTSVTSDKIDHNVNNNPNYLVYSEEAINAWKKDKKNDDYAFADLRKVDSPLKKIQSLAENQQWEDGNLNNRKRFGWTFHLDATRINPRHEHTVGHMFPDQDFVYYRRGANPTASPETLGLVVKYATAQVNEADSLGTTDRIRNMFQDGFEFKGYGTKTYTHIVLKYKGQKEVEPDWNTGPLSPGNLLLRARAEYNTKVNGTDQAILPTLGRFRDEEVNDDQKERYGGTYDLYETLDTTDDYSKEWAREEFAIIWVKPNDGESTLETFSVHLNDTSSDLHSESQPANKPKRRSFRQVSSLHTWPKSSNNQSFIAKTGVTKTWMGNVERQGQDEEGNYFLILSKPQHDILMIMDENDTLYERSHYWDNPNNDGSHDQIAKCRLAADGYPARRTGKRTLDMGETLTVFDTAYDELRNRVENNFLKANNKLTKRMRKGLFTLKDYPHVRWAGEAALLSSGSTLYLDQSSDGQQVSSGVTPSTPYGIRRGCSVVRSSGTNRYVGYVSGTGATNVTASIYLASALGGGNEGNYQGAWSAGDVYNIFVPYRAGMSIRCENLISGINGDFIITEIKYIWNNGRVGTQIEVIGINDEVVFKGRATLGDDDPPQLYEFEDTRVVNAASLAANAYTATGVYWWHDHELWETPNVAPLGKRNYNTFSWSGGQVRLNSSGDLYKFLAGDTDAALTTAGYTVTGGAWGDGTQNNPMQPYKQYVLFLDTADTPNEYGYHTIKIDELTHDMATGYARVNTFIELAYITTGDNRPLGVKTIGLPGPNFYQVNIDFTQGMCEIEFMSAFNNVWGLSSSLLSAARSIQPNSITSAILRKGAKPFASNLTFEAYNNLYNAVQWHDGDDLAATISFGDAGTASNITVVPGNSVQNGSGDQQFTFATGTTYFAYMEPDTDSKPHFSEDFADASTDDAFIVAIITIDTDTTQKSPTILPINSKVPTLSAVAIAADAITANAIKAGTIETAKLSVSAQGDLLNSNSDRAKTFAQNGIPTSVTIGDIWVDTNDGNKIYRAESVDATTIAAGHWVLVKEDNKIFRQEGITGGGSTYNNIPTSINIGDIWTDTDDQAMYFALSIGANAIVTSGSTGWMRRDDVLAINSASTSINGGLINTARIILKEGGAATDGLFMTADATFSPSSDQSYIQMDHTSIKGVSRTGTTNTTEFELKAENGRAEFGGGKVIAGASGLTVTSTDSSQGFIKFNNSSGTVQSFLMSATNSSWDRVQLGTADGTDVYIGMDDQPPGPTRISTPTIHLVSRYLNIPGNSTNSPKIYSMPTDNPIAGDVLACNTVTTGIVSPNTSTHNIYNLHWTSSGSSVPDPLRLSNGAVGAPTYSFTNHTTYGMYMDTSGNNCVIMVANGGAKQRWENGVTRFLQNAESQIIYPDGNNTRNSGSSIRRWKIVYGVTSNFTSDAALKENIAPITNDKGLDFITSLNPIQYNFIGDSQIHMGFTSQDVKEMVLSKGYTEELGIYTEEVDEDDELNPDREVSWGLVYNDFIAPLVASIKELKARIETLEGN